MRNEIYDSHLKNSKNKFKVANDIQVTKTRADIWNLCNWDVWVDVSAYKLSISAVMNIFREFRDFKEDSAKKLLSCKCAVVILDNVHC